MLTKIEVIDSKCVWFGSDFSYIFHIKLKILLNPQKFNWIYLMYRQVVFIAFLASHHIGLKLQPKK